jgi:hypothetical protein
LHRGIQELRRRPFAAGDSAARKQISNFRGSVSVGFAIVRIILSAFGRHSIVGRRAQTATDRTLASTADDEAGSRNESPRMSLNKKQKKQLTLAREKLNKLRQLLSNAKKQPDDPAEIPRLEKEIAEVEREIERIAQG